MAKTTERKVVFVLK